MKITCFLSEKARTVKIKKDFVLVGRSVDGERPDLDLTPDIYVSRAHAIMWVREGVFWIKDLDSKTGTKVNGQEIKGHGRQQVLPGDVLEIGDTKLQIDFSTTELLS